MPSQPKRPLLLSPRAQIDREDIYIYTLQEWGFDQAAKYMDELLERLRMIEENPGIGHAREGIDPKFQFFPYESHLIVYVEHDDHTLVVRILHSNSDVGSHL